MHLDTYITTATNTRPRQIIASWARFLLSWRMLGTVVCAVLLAKWAWVFFAPADVALPATTAWKKTDAAEHVFGDAPAPSTSAENSSDSIKLIGVFAHPSRGFAVLSVEGKQIGVGQGDEVAPGARLVETHADYVLIERGGARIKIDLPVNKVIAGISNVASVKENPPAIPDALARLDQATPEQRAAIQQELGNFRRRH